MKINHDCKNNQLSDTLSTFLKKTSTWRTSSSYRCLSWPCARQKPYDSASWPPVSTRQHHLLPATQERHRQHGGADKAANPPRLQMRLGILQQDLATFAVLNEKVSYQISGNNCIFAPKKFCLTKSSK